MKNENIYDILIIGAGPAGVGMGIILEKCAMQNYLILERNEVASSFNARPEHTRFISPSFCGNFFNAVDLNAVSPDTSPAFSLETEHPSGPEYAAYLQATAEHFDIKIQTNIEATKIEKKDDIFHVQTNDGTYQSKFLVRAGGEFLQPNDKPFDGSEYCIHSSKIETFDDDEYTIVGGYESGLELAAHLLSLGKKVTVLDSETPRESQVSDSSISVAPSTKDRLAPYIESEKFDLIGDTHVDRVIKEGETYTIIAQDGSKFTSQTKPILGTGFHSLPPIMQDHFTYDQEGNILLTEQDQSQKTSGLFLAGPRVKHRKAIFCFIYKFRQRFAIVAEHILSELAMNADGVKEYKDANMYLDDLSCCDHECVC